MKRTILIQAQVSPARVKSLGFSKEDGAAVKLELRVKLDSNGAPLMRHEVESKVRDLTNDLYRMLLNRDFDVADIKVKFGSS